MTAEIKRDYSGDLDKFHAAIAAYGETEDEYRASVVDVAIVNYMTTQNVDKKLSTAAGAPTREAVLHDWIASLRAKTYVKYLSTPGK
jgi:hypothetical protein